MQTSMFMRHDKHSYGARSFKEGQKPHWENHGL
jgi:hypothetical protein